MSELSTLEEETLMELLEYSGSHPSRIPQVIRAVNLIKMKAYNDGMREVLSKRGVL